MFWHEYAKIPRHTSQNAITEGDFKCILTRNCEGTEQLRKYNAKRRTLRTGIGRNVLLFLHGISIFVWFLMTV